MRYLVVDCTEHLSYFRYITHFSILVCVCRCVCLCVLVRAILRLCCAIVWWKTFTNETIFFYRFDRKENINWSWVRCAYNTRIWTCSDMESVNAQIRNVLIYMQWPMPWSIQFYECGGLDAFGSCWLKAMPRLLWWRVVVALLLPAIATLAPLPAANAVVEEDSDDVDCFRLPLRRSEVYGDLFFVIYSWAYSSTPMSL